MARKARSSEIIPGLPHHIVTRGNNRRRLFSYASDYNAYLRYMIDILDPEVLEIHQLSLMGNHTHMIATPDSVGAISSFMKRLNQAYARLRNDQRKGSGKLFEERFRSKPIETLEQLRITTLYNDTNYVRARPETGLFEHRWSTIRLHAGHSVDGRLREMWTPSAWYEALGESPAQRAEAYRQEVSLYVDQRTPPNQIVEWGWVEPSEAYTLRLERPNRTRAS